MRNVSSDLPLAEFKQLGKAFGTTVNNVVVTVCAGAVRKHLQEMGGLPDKPLVVCVPVSLRDGEESEPWANHVHMMFAPLPTHLADPVERLRAVTANTTRAKASFDALPKHLIRDGSRFFPRELFTLPVHAWVRAPHRLARVPWNLVVSNVRGPARPAFMNGLRVAGYCPASFMSVGGGVNITLQSYVDRIWFGLIGAPEQTGDLWRLAGHIEDALRELQALAPAPALALEAPAPVDLRPVTRVARRRPAKPVVDAAQHAERAGHDAER